MSAGATAPVAVVIVNRNGAAYLPRALEALSGQTLQPRRVLVVDNGSTDGSADAVEARFPAYELLRLGRNSGFAAANNRGVERAGDCEWVAVLNPDAFPEPNWLAALMSAVERNPEAAAFGSLAVRDDDPAVIDVAWLRLRRSWRVSMAGHGRPAHPAPSERDILVPSAVAALYRRDAYLAAGGFDESFFCYFEDVDLALRLALAGHGARFVPEAVVRHVGSASSGSESEFAVFHSQRNMVWSFVKAVPGWRFAAYLPLHLGANLGLVVWFTIRQRGRAALLAKVAAMRGLSAAWRERRRVRAAPGGGTGDLARMLGR